MLGLRQLAKVEEQRQTIEQLTKQLSEANDRIRETLEELQQTQERHANEAAEAKRTLSQTQAELEALQTRLVSVDERETALRADAEKFKTEAADSEQRYFSQVELLQKATSDLKAARTRATTMEQEKDRLELRLSEVNAELMTVSALNDNTTNAQKQEVRCGHILN